MRWPRRPDLPNPLGTLLLLAALPVVMSAGEVHDRLVAGYDEVMVPFLRTYCIACHGTKKAEEGLDYERLADGRTALARRDLWRLTAQKIAHFAMPPEHKPQPGDAERERVLAWVAALQRSVPPDPGSSAVRRLSTIEYRATIRRLFGVLPDSAADLPEESIGPGFTSAIPPVLMERYLQVADDVLAQVIRPGRYDVAWPAAALDTIPAMPTPADASARTFSGAGALVAVVHAPVDGAYTLTVTAGERTDRPEDPALLRVKVADRPVGEIAVKGAKVRTHRLPLKLVSGRLRLVIEVANPVFQRRSGPPHTDPVARGASPPAVAAGELVSRTITIEQVALTGPPAAAPTAWQRELFGAPPGKERSARDAAADIARRFATRAFRRPAVDAEVEHLLEVFALADRAGVTFTQAVALMLKATLISPQFLHLVPHGVDGSGDGVVPLTTWQLASRMSYLLWSEPPDEELLARAGDGTLGDAAVRMQQVERLLDDPRARALFTSFGAHWLGVDALQPGRFDHASHPQIDDTLRQAMYDEVALFFDAVVRERRSLLDFVTADHTWMNAPLAKLYGIAWEPTGPTWRRIAFGDDRRRGVLTMPAVLALTAQPHRTSPVKRGIWVLQNILGRPIPPAPMNVPPLDDQDTPANRTLSLRQRAERHRHDPACTGCHRILDPIGFGLEHFDHLGRWRGHDDTGTTVDAAGELPGGLRFSSTTDLLRLIGGRREEFCRTVAGRFLAFALCRPLQDGDVVVIDHIVAATAKDGFRFRTLIAETIASHPFLHRRLTP